MNNELPIGFSMALALNSKALQRFASMSDAQKQAVIDGAHQINSKEQMQRYVSDIVDREI